MVTPEGDEAAAKAQAQIEGHLLRLERRRRDKKPSWRESRGTVLGPAPDPSDPKLQSKVDD